MIDYLQHLAATIWSAFGPLNLAHYCKKSSARKTTAPALAFSTDSRVLATASQNGSVLLWDVSNLKP